MHLPLTLVELVLSDWDLEVVPGEFFATTVPIQHDEQFLVGEKGFLRILNLISLVFWVWESCKNKNT